ncbi:MAG: hypothetical protein GW906_02130 [Epsilonproteobacteria bacterium]|nr:hypothetical protein [Campylobacterota bacterium]OIO16461.1 MAG: hypothetical protein AUJ81_04450 [Helicobacteraceae bacterium CG1_02_36_14]PIP10411.1 MAG: hypothetical protein COX50_05840 [Sulfurimonas sp. CG23_combo_of_CG06-09_8_20_14_all_36_33]PIS27034.1 MAG: hypothetical protein COT46_00225 [Sulfurimonas sp. CG08_land_8_20_14_0_20_36_33]PIU33488.1 MAG: hypothetical protein COT05_11845 [Sulfurimonas sp. CG07_land_8_20_14_0_80_36_56]PIV05733.1 MAG: hypothetical protein COS56_00285 [Sulfur
MIAPIDFIKEKYIEPNNITQDVLCASLNIGKKTISELYQHKRSFTIHTAKKFAQFFNIKAEFILMKQLEYDLANDKEDYSEIIPFDVIANEDKKLNSAKWLLATINNSISDPTMHYSIDDLYEIFNNINRSKQYHYAILTLFKEVEYSDVIKYCELFSVKKSNLKQLYTFYKDEFKKEEIAEYEWLLEEL